MKKNTSSKIRLGIFITVGIAIFISAIYFIGEKQQLFRSTIHLSGVFKDVSGLQPGNNVRLSGVNIGTIDNIAIITDTSVRVSIVIDDKVRQFINKDAIASIGSEGLMGNKVLIINPGIGSSELIENNDVIATNKPIDLDDVMLSLKHTLENASSITGNLASITENIESGKGTIGRLIMDKSWRQNFDSIFTALKTGSAGFETIMSKVNSMDDAISSFKSTIANTSTITGNLADITGSIQSGKGMLGKLLMDESSAASMDSTFSNFNKASRQMNLILNKARSSWLLWGF